MKLSIIVAMFMALILLFAIGCTGGDDNETAFDDTDSGTVPEETIPEEETIPDETVPDETVPDETVPDETVPDETVPDETPNEVALVTAYSSENDNASNERALEGTRACRQIIFNQSMRQRIWMIAKKEEAFLA